MARFSGSKSPLGLSSGLSVLASFALILSLSGSLDTAFAADDPAAAEAKASHVDSLEIPGSFKDLPDARDAVTAKRPPEGIVSVTSTGTAPAELVIDAEKLARTDGAVYPENELVDFHATAYCLKGRTASGINTRPGVIAADPRVLPLGTVVHLRSGRYTGTYTVMDTGGRIKGRRVDVYVLTHKEAREFGRRQVKIKVLGRGSARKANKSLLASE